ncbi:MAG: hypothetical protein HC904_16010 [Blastochloris sp.]|nr:hypothetical protein [Blastochloris sp.]
MFASGQSPKTNDIIRFPASANVINIVETYGVDNTGKTDVTAKLNEIWQSFRKQPVTLYFPKGTYLVSGMVRGFHDTKRGQGQYKAGPYLVGESRTETIIRLKDGTWSNDPFPRLDELPQELDNHVVVHTGDSTNTTFYQVISNLTINTGRNNAGAIGLVYITSNSGHVANVDIISEDGQGAAGVALIGQENGPGMLREYEYPGLPSWHLCQHVLSNGSG